MENARISSIGMYVSILHRHEQRYVASIMKKYQLSAPSYSLLKFLSAHEGITQKKLCSALAVDAGLASRTMAQLEKEGYVTRTRSKCDPRAFELYLSDKAQEMIPELNAAYDRWWDNAWKPIPEGERQLLVNQLAEMGSMVSSEDEESLKERG